MSQMHKLAFAIVHGIAAMIIGAGALAFGMALGAVLFFLVHALI